MKNTFTSIQATVGITDDVLTWGRASLRLGLARELRITAGVSQRELAEWIGTTRVTINAWESGRHLPSGERERRYFMFLLELACRGKVDP